MGWGARIVTTMAIAPMPIDAKFLMLTQWLSPAYPIGAFAMSHGIEQAVQDDLITDAAGLEAWLRDCMTQGSARADVIWLRLGYCTPDVQVIDAEARAFAASHERLCEAISQGAAFVKTTNAVWDQTLPDLLLPVAVGRAASIAGLELEPTVQLYLQGFASNLIAVAQRLMPLGQTDGQRILAALTPVCIDVAQETRDAGMDDVYSNTFLSDISAMRHETLQPRIFQT